MKNNSNNDNNNTKQIIVYFDGFCQPINPNGIASYGFVIKQLLLVNNNNYQIENVIFKKYGIVGKPFSSGLNNDIAEYFGIIKALEWLFKNNYKDYSLKIRGDSKSVIFQIRKLYRITNITLQRLSMKVNSLSNNFIDVSLEWIPREFNYEADYLSRKAYVDYIDMNYDLVIDKITPFLASNSQLGILTKIGMPIPKYLSKIEAYRMLQKKNNNKKNQLNLFGS